MELVGKASSPMSWATYQPEKPPNRRILGKRLHRGRSLRLPENSHKIIETVCALWFFVAVETLKLLVPIPPHFHPFFNQPWNKKRVFSNNKAGKKKKTTIHPSKSGCPHTLFATTTFVCTAHQLEALHLYGCDSSRKTWTPGSQGKIGLQVPAIFHHLDVFILKSVLVVMCVMCSVMQKIYWKKVLPSLW